MPKNVMIVMVGLPRSGKSTHVDNFYHHYQVVCADDIRLGMGHIFDRNLENFVWAVHDTMIRAHLERGKNIVIDSTNTKVDKIKNYKHMADAYGYRFCVEVMKTTREICLKRNVGTRSVPNEVIDRMALQLHEMITSEFIKLYGVNYV